MCSFKGKLFLKKNNIILHYFLIFNNFCLFYEKFRSWTPYCLGNPATIKRGRFAQIIVYLNNNNI